MIMTTSVPLSKNKVCISNLYRLLVLFLPYILRFCLVLSVSQSETIFTPLLPKSRYISQTNKFQTQYARRYRKPLLTTNNNIPLRAKIK